MKSIRRVMFQCLSLAIAPLLVLGCGSANSHQQVLRNAEDLIANHQWDRAFKQLEELYRAHPKTVEARELQIVILLKVNQTDAAVEMYKDLVSRVQLPAFLNETIRHSDADVRAGACQIVAATKPSNSVYLLARASRDANPGVRRIAVQKLALFEGARARDALEDALLDQAWQVRADAAGSLETLADPRAAEHLFQSMLDNDEFVRLKVRRALVAIIEESNLSVYRRALRHSNRNVRTAAALALAKRKDGSAVAVLYEALSDPDPTARVAAARALAATGERSARPLLRESLNDPNPNVRASAALALAELGDVGSTNHLALLIETDPVDTVRLAASQAVHILSPEAGTVRIRAN